MERLKKWFSDHDLGCVLLGYIIGTSIGFWLISILKKAGFSHNLAAVIAVIIIFVLYLVVYNIWKRIRTSL
ncbi:hypothetical protein K8R42_00210 [bacterium]|nr:hypothetical protein [bacterium]